MSTVGTDNLTQEEEQGEESAFMSTSGIILVVRIDTFICLGRELRTQSRYRFQEIQVDFHIYNRWELL